MQMLLQFDQFQVISQAVLTLFRRNGNMAICLNKYLMKKQKFPKFYLYAECQIFFFVIDQVFFVSSFHTYLSYMNVHQSSAYDNGC